MTGINDFVADGNQTYNVILGSATSTDINYNTLNPADVSMTNIDDDIAGITVGGISGNTSEALLGTAKFSVKLNSKPDAEVTIDVSSNDLTEGSVSPLSLKFTPENWNADHDVIVTGVNDDEADGNQSFDIVLAAAVSTDGDYSGKNPADVSVTNIDDDSAGFTVSSIIGSTSESGDTATFNVWMNSKPSAIVTVDLSSTDITEGTSLPTRLTFTTVDWKAMRTVVVNGVNDDEADGNQSYKIVLAEATSVDAAYDGIKPADVSVTNIDNDSAGIRVSSISQNLIEGSPVPATFTVVLNSEPSADVNIGIYSNDESEGTITTANLTFTTETWNEEQTIIVTGVNDDEADGNQTFTIILDPPTSADENYSAINPTDVSVTNIDNNSAGIIVSTISGTTNEGGGPATLM